MLRKLRKLKPAKTAAVVVRPHISPVRKFVIGAAAIAAGIGLLYATYSFGLWNAGYARSDAVRLRGELRTEIAKLQDENTELRDALARAQRQLQIDQTAYEELNTSLASSTRELATLREELSFYQKIISPANKRAGVQIQDLKIEQSGTKDQYRYKLVLIQALSHDSLVTGSAGLEISGVQAGKQAVIRLPEAGGRPISVNFKYFQNIEGLIQLPPDFKPMRIKVSVSTTGRNADTLEQWYYWPQV